jgi:hypothetical protein
MQSPADHAVLAAAAAEAGVSVPGHAHPAPKCFITEINRASSILFTDAFILPGSDVHAFLESAALRQVANAFNWHWHCIASLKARE